MTRQARKAAAFKALHEGQAFIIPNPWDAGSARVFAGLGFKALATTSSGFAFTLGRHDGRATLDEVIEHTRALDQATELPLSVDLENGHGAEPEDAARAIERAAAAGAVGGSIEDYDRAQGTIYEAGKAVARVRAAAEAAHRLPFPFMFTARAENLIRGVPDLRETIARLQAFEDAGADVLFAPGLRTLDDIRTVCTSVSRPLNVLARPGLSLAAVVEAGARRISVGGGLTWVAVKAVVDAATTLRDSGDFSVLGSRLPAVDDWLAR